MKIYAGLKEIEINTPSFNCLAMPCPKCSVVGLQNYYTKPDGEHIVEYWRCPNCLEVIEVKY